MPTKRDLATSLGVLYKISHEYIRPDCPLTPKKYRMRLGRIRSDHNPKMAVKNCEW